MKVHFIVSALIGGGAERVLVLIANKLAEKNNYDITIITLHEGDDFYELNESIKRVSLKHGRFPNHTIKGLFNLFRHYKYKENRPDIIVSFMTLTNFISIIIAKLFSIKIIAEEHISHLENRDFLSNFTRKRIYNKADLVTVLTSFDIEYYTKYGAKVMVMPNPCSFPALNNNIINREKVILAVGNLVRYHQKGFDNLLDLIAPVLKSYPNWKLKIAGPSYGEESLNRLANKAKSLSIYDQVIFTGFVSNISEIMRSSSIFILSSRYEGLPMVLIEAMSQGIACIAYDCKTGPSDIITNKVNGLLIEDQNKEKMIEGLKKLILNEDLRIELGNKAINSVDKYHINSIINKYETAFKEILQAK